METLIREGNSGNSVWELLEIQYTPSALCEGRSFLSSVFRSHLIETTTMQEKTIVYPLEGH